MIVSQKLPITKRHLILTLLLLKALKCIWNILLYHELIFVYSERQSNSSASEIESKCWNLYSKNNPMDSTCHHVVFLVVYCHYQSESISVLVWMCIWELPHDCSVQLNCPLEGRGWGATGWIFILGLKLATENCLLLFVSDLFHPFSSLSVAWVFVGVGVYLFNVLLV